MSTDFKIFATFDFAKSDKYDKVYNWFKDRVGKSFTKTEISKNYRDFGFSRTEFANAFDKIIDNIKSVASLDDLVLNVERLSKNGYRYSLIQTSQQELSTDVIPLNELVNFVDTKTT